MGEFRIALCALVVTFAPNAAAQPSESIAQAEQLFEQARVLAAKGEYAAACPVFEASYKLDPALGTLLNMATCYENDGKLASAWGRYREVISVATKVADEARIRIAREKSAALEPRLPRLTIRAQKLQGLVVTRDDVPVDPAVLGAGIYVDPGKHVVTANAPKHRSVSIEVSMIEAETKIVEVPPLEALPEDPTQPTFGETRTIVIDRDDLDPGRNRRIAGFVLGGTGVAAVAVGLGFGISARSSWNSAFDDGLCSKDSNTCTKEGQERTNDARRNALVADVVTGIGIAALATGAVLYFTAPKKRDVSVTPVSGGAAVSIGGAW